MKTITENDTCISNDKPFPNINVRSSMIILKLKRYNVGRPTRFKARDVVLGSHQDAFGNEIEIYVPVVFIELFRALIALMLIKGCSLKHLHIKGAFLLSYLDTQEDVYISILELHGNKFLSGHILRLLKSLYGLRQAPKLLYKYLFEKLKKLCLIRSSMSDCFFNAQDDYVLLLYLDSMLLFGIEGNMEHLSKNRRKMHSHRFRPMLQVFGRQGRVS